MQRVNWGGLLSGRLPLAIFKWLLAVIQPKLIAKVETGLKRLSPNQIGYGVLFLILSVLVGIVFALVALVAALLSDVILLR